MEFLAISVLHFISSYLCPFFLKLVSHTHVHTGTVPPHLTQNLAPNWKNSLGYISCSVSPSQLSTAVLFLVMLLGFWVSGFGEGLCCWSSSLSYAWQKGQSGPQQHFSSLGLVECSFVFGSSFREGVVASSFLSSMAR